MSLQGCAAFSVDKQIAGDTLLPPVLRVRHLVSLEQCFHTAGPEKDAVTLQPGRARNDQILISHLHSRSAVPANRDTSPDRCCLLLSPRVPRPAPAALLR